MKPRTGIRKAPKHKGPYESKVRKAKDRRCAHLNNIHSWNMRLIDGNLPITPRRAKRMF